MGGDACELETLTGLFITGKYLRACVRVVSEIEFVREFLGCRRENGGGTDNASGKRQTRAFGDEVHCKRIEMRLLLCGPYDALVLLLLLLLPVTA